VLLKLKTTNDKYDMFTRWVYRTCYCRNRQNDDDDNDDDDDDGDDDV